MRVKELLKEKGMTAKELAARLGMTAALGVEVTELFAPKGDNTIVCPKCGTILEVKPKE